jgi:RHS repeat-associated protein
MIGSGSCSSAKRPSSDRDSTGKERDAETGLDYFGFRYYSGAQGRFTSPDEPFADQYPEDPQSWNLYSYVGNSPLNFVDDDGRGKLGVFYKTILKPIMIDGRRVMFRKTTKHRYSRDEARRLLRKEGRPVYAPGRKSARNSAGRGARDDPAHPNGVGETGAHFNLKNGGHAYYGPTTILPGAALGVGLFGDNIFGKAVDLINPISDYQDFINLVSEIADLESEINDLKRQIQEGTRLIEIRFSRIPPMLEGQANGAQVSVKIDYIRSATSDD